jgi:hypothetical protein
MARTPSREEVDKDLPLGLVGLTAFGTSDATRPSGEGKKTVHHESSPVARLGW